MCFLLLCYNPSVRENLLFGHEYTFSGKSLYPLRSFHPYAYVLSFDSSEK